MADGLKITIENEELLISGSKLDLLELADYIVSVAKSDNDRDHIHIDNMTLISEESQVKNAVIEKVE